MLTRRYFALAVPGMIVAGLSLAGCTVTGGAPEATASTQSRSTQFEPLAGTWSGTLQRADGGSRPITIVMRADGRYRWTSGTTHITDGRLTMRGSEIRYTNEAGSRGVVTISGNALVWRNTFTGNTYTVTVRRVP
jgi:hypothetical protein